jgi:hypothetical protein
VRAGGVKPEWNTGAVLERTLVPVAIGCAAVAVDEGRWDEEEPLLAGVAWPEPSAEPFELEDVFPIVSYGLGC